MQVHHVPHGIIDTHLAPARLHSSAQHILRRFSFFFVLFYRLPLPFAFRTPVRSSMRCDSRFPLSFPPRSVLHTFASISHTLSAVSLLLAPCFTSTIPLPNRTSSDVHTPPTNQVPPPPSAHILPLHVASVLFITVGLSLETYALTALGTLVTPLSFRYMRGFDL